MSGGDCDSSFSETARNDMLDEILSPRRIFLDLKAAPKGELLLEMARRLAQAGDVEDPDALARRLIKREDMISTGVKEGYAFPHVFSPQVEELKLTIGVIKAGTDYESLDGKPVYLVLMLIGPEAHQDTHLRILARLSRVATEPGMRESLLEAESAEAIVEIISESDRLLAVVP